jgi:ABC-2 type transport system ATP-binding protein
MQMNQTVLKITHLKKYFKDVHAVDDISLEVRAGEIYGLLGPNGAGKTTTIKNLLGLLEPDEGTISVIGLDPITDTLKVKQQIGYVAEEPLIYKSLTPREMFNFIVSIRDLDEKKTTKTIQDLLESLEATKYYDSPIITLSKGNKQKMQIIAALIHDPDLIILDEPLSGLDARSSRVVKDILKLKCQTGHAILLSTHVMEVAQDMCTRIGVLNNGKLVAEGTLEELRNNSHEAGKTLEDIFLKLTDQDESVKNVMDKLRTSLD